MFNEIIITNKKKRNLRSEIEQKVFQNTKSNLISSIKCKTTYLILFFEF